MSRTLKALERVLAHLEKRLKLVEIKGPGRGPALAFGRLNHAATWGNLRQYAAPGLDKLVLLSLDDGVQLEGAMLMGFTNAGSAVPHLVLDCAQVARDYAVFVDLVPRVDLAVHPEYVEKVYRPLTEAYESLQRHPGLRAAPVPRTLAPYTSPWISGFRCAEPKLAELFELVGTYVSHWCTLLKSGIDVGMTPEELAQRDRLHRAAMYSKGTDPVWEAVERMIGAATTDQVLMLLRRDGNSLPPPPPPDDFV